MDSRLRHYGRSLLPPRTSYSATSRFIVGSVEYRLAPEYPFPIPFNDCWDVLRWAMESTESLGGDRKQLYLAGSSAGGNLAAALAMQA